MKRMKTFFIYFILFVGLYVISNLLINAYIKTSYYKITSYNIDVQNATITITTAKASKDGGHIDGKISNNTKEAIENKYMRVELFSENDVSLGKEYVKINSLNPGKLKKFNIDFTCDNVKRFTITLVDNKDEEDLNQNLIPTLKTNPSVSNILNEIEIK